jgi:hypothetical protein
MHAGSRCRAIATDNSGNAAPRRANASTAGMPRGRRRADIKN